MSNKSILYRDDVFPFGKYRGEKVGEVVIQDPRYIEWFSTNVSNYTIMTKVLRPKEDYVKLIKWAQGSNIHPCTDNYVEF